jgi:hypothetical protein
MRGIVLLLVVSFLCNPYGATTAFAEDKVAPAISNVKIGTITDNSVTVTWETNESADSLVNYGLQEDYGILRTPVADKMAHTMKLDNLDPGRVYYFRVVSADAEGNQGISADYKVQTTGTPQADGKGQANAEGVGAGEQAGNSDATALTPSKLTATEIQQEILQIKDPQQLKEILNETVKAIKGITEDLTIVGPPTVVPETNTALVRWSTDRESTSKVLFSKASNFTGGSYEFAQESTNGPTTNHEVRLIGLEAFTEYHFKVESTDAFSITGESRDYTFVTKASLPDIRNLRIVKVEENSATLAWDTTVPAKALIEYQDLTTGAQNSKGRPTLATTHQMQIDGLTLGTRYVAFVIAENGGGDRIKSQPITFITVKDTAPPIISNVSNESTLFPGGDSRVQSIVEWKTDEPAFCTMTYREGVASGVDPTVIEEETVSYTEKHVEVIVDFAPGTVYQFWLNCEDEAKNSIQSENFVLFTPIQEKSIIDLILENFQSTFGWIKNIKGA